MTTDIGRIRRALMLRLLAIFAILALVGCDRGPATAQVSGNVKYKDGTVPKGGVCVVRFEPAEDTTAEIRKTATGNIEPDGSFKLSTKRPGDGVYLGSYNVTFAVWKGPRDPTSLIKEIYSNSATTPYHVTVDGDQSDLSFEIEPK